MFGYGFVAMRFVFGREKNSTERKRQLCLINIYVWVWVCSHEVCIWVCHGREKNSTQRERQLCVKESEVGGEDCDIRELSDSEG